MKKSEEIPAGPVRILCSASAAFAAPLCVMLVSLLSNHARGRKIEIHVLGTNIPEEDRRKIEASLVRNRPDFQLDSLHWLSPNFDVLEGLPVFAGGDLEANARLLAPRVLPDDFDKILYLDSDLVILSDLSPLYDSVCEGSAVHAARDPIGYVSDPQGVFNYQDLGIPSGTPYFNAGVLLMNLRLWRERDITGRIFDYMRLHRASVHCSDQGGLNAILYDSWTEIDPAWNQMPCVFLLERWRELGRSMADWKRTLYHPRIVHYLGKDKPWTPQRLPGYSHFFDYLDRTSYRTVFKGPRWEHYVGFRLNYYLWRMRIISTRFVKDTLRPWLKSVKSPSK